MTYTIKTIEGILPYLKEDVMRMLLTEHFLEKMEHRGIDDDLITDVLADRTPKSIVQFKDSDIHFELTYEWDDEEDLVIIVSAHPPRSVMLISAYFREVFDEENLS